MAVDRRGYPQRAPGSRCGRRSTERDPVARRSGGTTRQWLAGSTSSGSVHRPHPIEGGPPTSAHRPVVARCCQWRTAPEGIRKATVSACRRSVRPAADLPPDHASPASTAAADPPCTGDRSPAGGRVAGPARRSRAVGPPPAAGGWSGASGSGGGDEGSPPGHGRERPLPPPGRVAVTRSRAPGERSGVRRSTPAGGWPARRGRRRARPRTGCHPARRCSSGVRG